MLLDWGHDEASLNIYPFVVSPWLIVTNIIALFFLSNRKVIEIFICSYNCIYIVFDVLKLTIHGLEGHIGCHDNGILA